MAGENSLTKNWINTGIVCGLLAACIYPLLIFLPMPEFITILLASAWGPLLSIASIGLYYIIKLNKKTVTLQIAAVSNIIAGVLVNVMFIVQLSRRFAIRDHLAKLDDPSAQEMLRWISKGVYTVQAGLDVSWDIYIGIGTFLFGLNMLLHPRFGKVIGWSGMLIAVIMLAFNLYTFPQPPADAGLIDLGPLIGFWYFVVVIQIMRSRTWVETVISQNQF